jgi:hypothetical protein
VQHESPVVRTGAHIPPRFAQAWLNSRGGSGRFSTPEICGKEVRAWQERALRDFFQQRPLALLEEAMSLKKKTLCCGVAARA